MKRKKKMAKVKCKKEKNKTERLIEMLYCDYCILFVSFCWKMNEWMSKNPRKCLLLEQQQTIEHFYDRQAFEVWCEME